MQRFSADGGPNCPVELSSSDYQEAVPLAVEAASASTEDFVSAAPRC